MHAEKKQGAKISLLVAIILLAVGIIMFAIGMYKIAVYEAPSSEYSMVGAKNAYVGGDAYNFIINGTYFSGFMAFGGGCVAGACVFGATAIRLISSVPFKDEKKNSDTAQESTQ